MDQVDTYLMTGISSSAPHYTIGTKPLEILSTGPLSYLIINAKIKVSQQRGKRS